MIKERYARYRLKLKIETYLKKEDKKSKKLVFKKISKQTTKKEQYEDLKFYIRYCQENTLIKSEGFKELLNKIATACKKNNKTELQKLIKRLSKSQG